MADEMEIDIDAEMEKIRIMQEEANAKMRALYEMKREQERKKLENAITNIDIKSVVGNTIFLTVNNKENLMAPIRNDILNFLRSIRSRSFNPSNNTNSIAIGDFEEFEERVQNLPNVNYSISDENKLRINRILRAPMFEVDINSKFLTVTPGPNSNAFLITRNIPAAKYDSVKLHYNVPLTEGWRLAETLATMENVIWSDAAREYVLKQAENRASLDIIAQLEDAPEIDPKFVSGITLRPFQRVDVKFALATGGRVLIANQVGLGKTIEALALHRMLEQEQKERGNDKMFRTLVIAPAHLKTNWLREIYKHTGTRAAVMMGREPNKLDMISLLAVEEQRPFTFINYHSIRSAAEVSIVKKDTEGYLHENNNERFFWIDLLNMAKFDLVVIDEAHYIKDVDSQQSKAVRMIKAPRIVELSATPVMNRPAEFWPMLHMINPNIFDSQERFKNQYTIDGKNARNVEELRQITKTMMIRRLKKDVQKELPPIVPINQYHTLSEKAKKVYDKVLAGVYETVSSSGENIQKNVTNILVQIQRCKQVCAYDKMDATAQLANEVYDGSEGDSHRKVIIFSQYEATVKGIAGRLREDGCLYIVGAEHSPDARMRIVDEFQTNPEVKYLVISTKAGSEGLNITAAGHIIFHDLMWTPAAHDQAIGRAYGRESDLHGVECYYMIAEDTIEEWIIDLLEEKMRMINEVVEGIEGSRNGSIAMELINKIKESMWKK